jgi:hypothetical protein
MLGDKKLAVAPATDTAAARFKNCLLDKRDTGRLVQGISAVPGYSTNPTGPSIRKKKTGPALEELRSRSQVQPGHPVQKGNKSIAYEVYGDFAG